MADWPYNTGLWKRLREAHLSLSPACVGCQARGILTIANTVDHITAISEGGPAFPDHDGLTSYCTPCHSAKTARSGEAGAVRSTKPRRGCDAAGNPIDPSHPWNGGTGSISAPAEERRMPTDLKPSRIPLTIVCGPPGSGKSTYVRANAAPGDLVICLDAIMQGISGLPEHHTSSRLVRPALEQRNAMLRALATDRTHNAAWFIVAAPDQQDRRLWAARLKAKVVVLRVPLAECVARIKTDETRPREQHERMIEMAMRWWALNGEPELKKSLGAAKRRPNPNLNPQLVLPQIAPESQVSICNSDRLEDYF